jgi:hypothetical protein
VADAHSSSVVQGYQNADRYPRFERGGIDQSLRGGHDGSRLQYSVARLSRGAKFNGMACSVRFDSPVSRQDLTGFRGMSVPAYSAGLALYVVCIFDWYVCEERDITHGVLLRGVASRGRWMRRLRDQVKITAVIETRPYCDLIDQSH